jgi:hypothetical protein
VTHCGTERKPGEEVRVARVSAFVVGAVAMTIAMLPGPTANVAFLGALAFVVAASANRPIVVLSIFLASFRHHWCRRWFRRWPARFHWPYPRRSQLNGHRSPNITGAARHLVQSKPWFPLKNPELPVSR